MFEYFAYTFTCLGGTLEILVSTNSLRNRSTLLYCDTLNIFYFKITSFFFFFFLPRQNQQVFVNFF